MPEIHIALNLKGNSSGPWMPSLLNAIKNTPSIQITVAAFTDQTKSCELAIDGINYKIFGSRKNLTQWRNKKVKLDQCLKLIDELNPDLIHIHGTEHEFGLICTNESIKKKTIISLQGILGACASRVTGSLTLLDQIKATTPIEMIRGAGVLWQRSMYTRRAKIEKQIFENCQNFIGRTEWDHAYVKSNNSSAYYSHIDEILRPPFYEAEWKIEEADPHSIIFTNITGPLKGADTLLAALTIIKEKYPNVKLRLAGQISQRSGYGKWIKKLIAKYSLAENVHQHGFLSAEQIIELMKKTRVFVSCSHIDNSPNSLAEAQIIGMPCIATAVGGVPSMVNDKITGLLIPVNEPELLAQKIIRVFEDSDLSKKLSKNAKEKAQERHSIHEIKNRTIKAYKNIAESRIKP